MYIMALVKIHLIQFAFNSQKKSLHDTSFKMQVKKDYSMVPEYISATDGKIFPSFSRLLIAHLQSPNLKFFNTGHFFPNSFGSVK